MSVDFGLTSHLDVRGGFREAERLGWWCGVCCCHTSESLVSRFIESEGYSMPRFYEEVRQHLELSGGEAAERKQRSGEANEVGCHPKVDI